MRTTAEFSVPKKGLSYIGKAVVNRWNQAVRWRSQETIGNGSVDTVLRECHDQRNGIYQQEDIKDMEALGVKTHVNISELKVSALVAWFRDLLTNTTELPFTVEPTPIPELSKSARLEVLESVKKQVFGGEPIPDLMAVIKQLKYQQLKQEKEYADRAAGAMMKLISDQCVEGGFDVALLRMINDISTYPFAVMHGPIPTNKTVMEWRGNNIASVNKIVPEFRPVSVFNFLWMPDCSTAQDGAGVFIRERMSKSDLVRCKELPAYNKDEINSVLNGDEEGRIVLDWTVRNPEEPVRLRSWETGQTIDVVKHYGVFSGRELRKMNISSVEDGQFYEASVDMIAGRIIRASLIAPTTFNIRPAYTASFETVGDKIAGRSVCQKVRDVDRAFTLTIRFLLLNSSFSAAPISEGDIDRLSHTLEEEDLGTLVPGIMYLVRNMGGGGRPAINVYNIPNHASLYATVAQFFMTLADRVTQIPAMIHGEPVGTGVNRTARGVAMLYGNAIKPIQAAVANMDKGIFGPLGTAMYYHNLMNVNDPAIKGDAKVRAAGASGLIGKEVQKQTSMEVLQLLASMGGASGDPRLAGAMNWAVEQALSAFGIPSEEIAVPMGQMTTPPVVEDALNQLPGGGYGV